MKRLEGWPEGVMKVINHPFRTKGWHHFFSECPNDAYYFGLDLETPADLHRLLKVFSTIKADKLILALDPNDGGHHVEGAAAVFSLGNQPIIDQWYKHLKIDKDGKRVFGVNRYTEPPTAQPPTLTIYTGHRAVDLDKLRLPEHLLVRASIAKVYREKFPDRVKAIEAFIQTYKQGLQKQS